ncbi:MAG: hypothetical protein PHI97_32690 [Desulfobulbus sp.]|nr:hypothetical protein [Desulfobulbus sp.]
MPQLKISFLNVGHGDFTYATTPLGDNLVIDVGSGAVVPSKFLSKISTISELQVSHPHTDHFDDIIGLSAKTIKSFRCPSLTNFLDEKIGWRKSDKGKITKLRQMKKNLAADNGAVKVGSGFGHTVWFPPNIDNNDPNTASIVTILSYKGVKVLFGGDLPASGWEALLKKKEFVTAISGTTIFKVPHHGRTEGCCEALFNLIKPKLCVISDKPIEKDNKNTASTSWYSVRSSGCKVVGASSERKVVSTRSDGSIFISVDDKGSLQVCTNTAWRKE